MGTLRSNGLIMMILVYTKQIIHVSGPLDETSFFARDRLIFVLGQKGDLATCYSQIICYARLLLNYTNMYLFTDRISVMNLWAKPKVHWGNFGVHLTMSYSRIFWYARPGQERRAITLACSRTHHIKNLDVVCCTPKTLYGVLLLLFLIHLFSTLLITLFTTAFNKNSICLYSTFS